MRTVRNIEPNQAEKWVGRTTMRKNSPAAGNGKRSKTAGEQVRNKGVHAVGRWWVRTWRGRHGIAAKC